MTRPLNSLLALLLVACAGAHARGPVDPATRRAYSELLVAPEQCGANASETVTPEQMARDWSVVERVLRRGYAGFELAGDEARWARAFEAARGAIPEAATPVTAFRDEIVSRLRFVDDNHLSFTVLTPRGRDWRSTSGHRQAYTSRVRFDGQRRDAEGNVLTGCGGRDAGAVLRPTLQPDGAVVFAPIILSDTALESIDCTLRDPSGEAISMELPLHRVDLGDARGPRFQRREAPFTWLRLRTLFASQGGELERFVESAEAARAAPVTVLDLRDIGGGADRYLNRWFAAYTDQDLDYWDTTRIVSEVALAGALAFWRCVGASSGGDASGRAWIEARIERAERELDEAMHTRGVFRELVDGEYVVEGRAPRAPQGPLVLVVNRRCASACETSVVLARQIPGALVIGENTEGTMKVGEIRTYRLPESGIVVTAGTRIHRDPVSGSFPEGVGWQPDLWVDGGAEEVIPALARCLQDTACEARLRAAIRPEG